MSDQASRDGNYLLTKTSLAKPYWTEVLDFLVKRKNGRKEH